MIIFRYFECIDRKTLYSMCISTLLLIVSISLVTLQQMKGIEKGSDALLKVPLIDGHNDVPSNLREILKNKLQHFNFDKNLTNDPVWGRNNCKTCFTDLPRMKQGRLGAQFWAAYVVCGSQYKDAVAQTLEQIDVIKRLVQKYPKDMMLVKSADEILVAFKNKKIGSLIGVEGGHSIDSRLGVLRIYYELGARYMTITHACNTPWADASPTVTSMNDLTEFGKKIILEMNRLGMMVDLSHVSVNVMRDALNVSKAPVIFSHSNAYSIYNHHRNVPDDVLLQLKENGGIIMINFYTPYIAEGKVTIFSVMDHINYIAELIGPEYIGIGSDFDGVDSTPIGLEDVSKYPALFDMLFKHYPKIWTESNLEKLAGKNLLRVFKEVENVRDKLSKQAILEDWIPRKDMQIIPRELFICRTETDVSNCKND